MKRVLVVLLALLVVLFGIGHIQAEQRVERVHIETGASGSVGELNGSCDLWWAHCWKTA